MRTSLPIAKCKKTAYTFIFNIGCSALYIREYTGKAAADFHAAPLYIFTYIFRQGVDIIAVAGLSVLNCAQDSVIRPFRDIGNCI
jgi:hypothetical protein